MSPAILAGADREPELVDLPYGEFTAHLAGTRITVTPSARMVVSSLIQWNAGAGSLTSSARLR